MRRSSRALSLLLVGLLPFAISGCSVSTGSSLAPDAGLAIQGRVHGGQQPIVGAHVYLFAANTTGAGGASLSLLTSVGGSTTLDSGGGATNGDYYVTTGVGGAFTITGDYSCTPNTQVYVYALGGNPGLSGGTNNLASGLMAALGNCPSAGNFVTAAPFVFVDEVSTIAAAYAMAGFATDATHVSSGSTAAAKQGIANAFANASNLASLTSGAALSTTPAGNGAVPQSTVNTLANILASCVNTSGAVTGPIDPTACYTLLNNALSAGTTGTQPTDTATAAINIAHNPGANIAALYTLASATPPFAPALSAQPKDFTVGLKFTGGGLNAPWQVAIDGSGDAWIANFSANSVTELSSLGAPISPSGGYTGGGLNGVYGIAVDAVGNAWVTNHGGNSVTELSSTGVPSAGSPYTAGGLNGPYGIAIDGAGNVWVANAGGSSVTELSSAGTPSAGSPYSGGGLSNPAGIAMDGSGDAWVASFSSNAVVKFSPAGAVLSGSGGYTGGGLNGPYGVGMDGSGNVWVTNFTGSSVTELSGSGSAISGSGGFTGGGLSSPYGIAMDGSGAAWIANHVGGVTTELSSSGAAISPAGGYASGLGTLAGIAVDGSGDVWIPNSASGANAVTELIGAAAPVTMPIAAGLPAPSINFTTTTLPAGTQGSAYSSNVTAKGGAGALTYTVAGGFLPAGVTLSSGGVLSGLPTTAGTSAFTVTASDGYGNSGSVSLTITIAANGGTQTTTVAGSVLVNGVPRSMVLYTNGSQQLAYACSDSQINIVDVTNPTSPVVLSTFANSLLTENGNATGFQAVECAVYKTSLIVSYGREDGNSTTDSTAVPMHFATFSLASPLSPTQVGSVVSIDRPDSGPPLVVGNSALFAQHRTTYNQFSGFVFQENGDVWAADLTNAPAAGSVSYLSDLYPCGGINSSTSACNDGVNVPTATFSGGACVVSGTAFAPNDQYLGGPYPIYPGTTVNSTTAYYAGSSAYGGNVEQPGCPPIAGQLLVVDATNPSALAIATSVSVPQAAFLTGVAVQGNTAVAVGDDTGIYSISSGFVGSLVIATFDVTNPKSPVLLDSVAAPLTDQGGASVVALANGKFAIGGTSYNGNPALVQVDASSPGAFTYGIYSTPVVASPVIANVPNFYTLSATPLSSVNELSILHF